MMKLWLLLIFTAVHTGVSASAAVNNTFSSKLSDFRWDILRSFELPVTTKEHFMNDVLAIVHFGNFNHSMEQVQTYHTLWKPIFPRMVFFGVWDHGALTEFHKHGLPAFHSTTKNENGFMAHAVMLQALRAFQHRSFKGYLYIHDDMLISPKKLVTLDKNKMWNARDYTRISLEPWNNRKWDWPWFNGEYGIDSMQRILDSHSDIKQGMEQCYDDESKQKGDIHTWWYGSSDIYYIPKADVPRFIKIVEIFVEIRLFLEIAIGTYMKCFSSVAGNVSQLEPLELCTSWDARYRDFPEKWSHCKDKTEIIHPVKFSRPRSYEFAVKWLTKHNTTMH